MARMNQRGRRIYLVNDIRDGFYSNNIVYIR
jgi:hypothetical protein